MGMTVKFARAKWNERHLKGSLNVWIFWLARACTVRPLQMEHHPWTANTIKQPIALLLAIKNGMVKIVCDFIGNISALIAENVCKINASMRRLFFYAWCLGANYLWAQIQYRHLRSVSWGCSTMFSSTPPHASMVFCDAMLLSSQVTNTFDTPAWARRTTAIWSIFLA